MEKNESILKMDDKFLKNFIPQKHYHTHSSIDLWINITIMQLLNYNKLLGKKLIDFIQENKKYNSIEIEEKIKKDKLQELKILSEGTKSHSEKSKKEKNSILEFEIPDCELYFIVKLYVDEIERKPHYQTKLVFNTKNINQNISFKFKYKDLTENSFIIIEIYSLELPPEKSFLGSSKIFLFDENLNLNQGRHINKIYKKLEEESNKNEDEDENENEIENLINSFYGKEFNNSQNYYGEGKEKNGITIKDSKINIEENIDNYYYNNEEKEPQIKTELMKNFDWKLNELLSKTKYSFIVVKFPSFNNPVIYEEEICEDYKKIFKYGKNTNEKEKKNSWVYDSNFYKGEKDITNKENPLTEKFLSLSKNDDSFAKEIKLNPYDRGIINKLLNKPDFIEYEKSNIFWNYRYELLRNDTHFSLTKIMNSVKWGDIKNESEFIKNILNNWKTIELCDILYMLSRKFSVNPIYINDYGLTNNLTGLKTLRKFAVKKLSNHSTTDLNFILLQLVQAIKYEDISVNSINSPLVIFLVNKCKTDLTFASSFYWFIECESNLKEKSSENEKKMAIIFSLIEKYFKKEMRMNSLILDIIDNEIEFKKELEDISNSINSLKLLDDPNKKLKEIIDKDKLKFMYNEEHYLPIDPKIKIKGVDSEDCKRFTSSQHPIKFTFKITQDTRNNCHFKDDNKFSKIFFKCGDDLRQDQLILQIISFMDSLLKKVQLDYEFTTYKVLATTKDDGFVEFVPNSKTYLDILKEYKQLKNYYKDISETPEDYEQYLDSFINSLAGYCAVNYILGIGDRHNQNLMFDKRGKMFHIDFGFILNKDPKKYFPFKITKDMVDCIGGVNSERYKKFKQKCVNAYLILRDNARTIVNMFYLMIDSGIPDLNANEILNIHRNFEPDLTKEQASISFLKKLEDTLNSYIPYVIETIHGVGQYFQH